VDTLSLATAANSSGTFSQSGGVGTIGTMNIGVFRPGTVLISGGNINSVNLNIGQSGDGTMSITGGTVSVSGTVNVSDNNPGGSGFLSVANSGKLIASSLTIHNGGTVFLEPDFVGDNVTAGTVTLAAGGTWNSPTSENNEIPFFLHNGGTIEGRYFVDQPDRYVYNSGLFQGRLANLGTVEFNADFTASDGWEVRNSGSIVPAGRTVTLGGLGFALGSTTFTHAGTLLTSRAIVGDGNFASASVFNHNSGLVTSTGSVLIGTDRPGVYNLNSGTLDAQGAASNGIFVGHTDFGTVNIGAGRLNMVDLTVGAGAAGTISHAGTGDLFGTNLTVGGNAPGRYTHDNAGAVVSLSGQLLIASTPAAAASRYDLLNGTLLVGNGGATTNNGTFNQSGGRATLQAVGGTGRMDITGTASLTVNRIRQDFLFVADTARVFTVGNGGPAGLSRLESLFFEDFENLNFFGRWDLNNNDLIVDSDTASQAVEYDRTKRYIKSGFANGSWNGTGLNSSAAIAAASTLDRTGLGYVKAADVFTSFPATFVGETVDNTTVLVRYTLLGDADLDGTVNIGDFAFLASNFNLPRDWRFGDFNYDGTTNIGDFALLASNFNQSLAAGLPRGAAVPEPALLAPLGLLWLAPRARRGNGDFATRI